MRRQFPFARSRSRRHPKISGRRRPSGIFREIGDPSAERLEGIFGQVEAQIGKEEFGKLVSALQPDAEAMRLAGVAVVQQAVGDDEMIREITERLSRLTVN